MIWMVFRQSVICMPKLLLSLNIFGKCLMSYLWFQKGYREVWVLKKIVSLSPTTWAADLELKLEKYPRKSIKYFKNPKILKIWHCKLKMHFSPFFVEKLSIFNSDSFFWQKIDMIWHLTWEICTKIDDFSLILQFWAQLLRFWF